ncbi:SH3 domain-containing protein [Planotetraspora thailandica]|uniref:SH3 domain-containing protein n=1 Tax=Planotetraspora thailandica TaxID=487172 RepID=UPI0019522927|nr:SH3 domain-containing protein [Planotetraspora thailandica]
MRINRRVIPALATCAATGWLASIPSPAEASPLPTHQAQTCTYQVTNLRTGGYLNVRTAPTLKAQPVGTLRPTGARLTGGCTSTLGWVSVKASNGRSGWASGHYLRKTTPVRRISVPARPSLACTYQVANVRRSSFLNVRTAPAVGARRVGALRVSDGRFAGGCTSTHGWTAVKSSNGRSGWAAAHYLRKTSRTPLAASTVRAWGCVYQLAHVQPSSMVTVYSGRGATYQPVGTLTPADGRFGGGCTATQGWVPVTSSNGRPGWVSSYYVQRIG